MKLSTKRHRCLVSLDRQLRSRNTRLVQNVLNQNHVIIATELIDESRRRDRPAALLASYCPVCGERLPE